MTNPNSIQLNSETAQQAKATAAQVNAQERAAPTARAAVKVGGTTQRITYNNGIVSRSSESAVAKGTNAPINQVGSTSQAENTNVVSAKSPMGRNISGDELRKDSVVSLGGMQSTVAGLAAAGFIAKNANGVYEWTAKGRVAGGGGEEPQHRSTSDTDRATSGNQQEPAEQQQQQQEPPAFEKLDNEGEALLQAMNEKIPAHEFQGAVRDVIASNGQLSPEVIDLAAQRLGISNEEAAAKAGTLLQSFQRQADAAIGSHAQQVYDWGWQNNPQEMRTLVDDFVRTGNTRGLSALGHRYMSNLDVINPAAILNSEEGQKLKARLEPNGRVSIEHPQSGRMLWSAGVKAGLFNPKFNKAS